MAAIFYHTFTVLILFHLVAVESALQQQKTLYLNEGTPIGSPVYSFPTPPAGEIYSIDVNSATSDVQKYFVIQDGESILKTRHVLQYNMDKSNTYDIIVIRRPAQRSYGGTAYPVRVVVVNVNNQKPVFPKTLYHGYIYEGNVNNRLVKGIEDMYASDLDGGSFTDKDGHSQNYGVNSFEILGDNLNKFTAKSTVDIGSGMKFVEIRTSGEIKRSDTPEYNLVVRAYDKDRNSFGFTKVNIKVLDKNDFAPSFASKNIDKTIDERTSVKTDVLRVHATDQDSGTNSYIFYYLKQLNDYFVLNSLTGYVTLVKQLNYDKLANGKVLLTVVAQDRGVPPKKTEQTVTITVQDQANYPPTTTTQTTAPKFPSDSYSYTVYEDFPVNGLIHMQQVEHVHSDVTYSLSSTSTYFELNSGSGALTLKKKLVNTENIVKITATNNAGSTTTTVTVTLLKQDANKHYPEFNPSQKVARVPEDTITGIQVFKVSASDGDSSGINSQLKYFITGGTGVGAFAVAENTGSVTTLTAFDRESEHWYTLYIEARDQGLVPKKATLFVMTEITNKPDVRPQFVKLDFSDKIPEGSLKDTFVTAVQATSSDMAFSADVKYSITSGNDNQYFAIEDPSVGIITTAKTIPNAESGRLSYILKVKAAVNGLSSTALVLIEVINVNTVQPNFVNTPYTVRVLENQGQVTSMACIAATNAESYSVVSIDPDVTTFGIDSQGKLSLLGSLDFETVSNGGGSVDVKVEASDTNTPPLKATTVVKVIVEDVDDLPSLFPASLKIDIAETQALQVLDGKLTIDDKDDPTASMYDCVIWNSNAYVLKHFKTLKENDKCVIQVIQSLDYNEEKSISFNVRAVHKNTYVSAESNVQITISDVNNKSPVFERSIYLLAIPATISDNMKIVTVKATDEDTGKNGAVTYELTAGNGVTVDSNSGEVKTNPSTTWVTNSEYTFTVTAKDGGTPLKSSSVDIKMTVYDGSARPVFTGTNFAGSISEFASPGTSSGKVTATYKSSSSGISYRIVGGNSDNKFLIDSNGNIRLNLNLNYKEAQKYNLILQAEATLSGSTKISSLEQTFTVSVIDGNKAPEFGFSSSSVKVSINSFSPKDYELIKAPATDEDDGNNGKITYSLIVAGYNPFKVNSAGVITTTEEIRYSKQTSYNIKLKALDGGSDSTILTIDVKVRDVKESPKFDSNTYTREISENKNVGAAVGAAVQVSYDVPNAVKYSIVAGDSDGKFCINSVGLITTTKVLDREQEDNYVLKIEAAVLSRTTVSTIVNINVVDRNDNPPKFSKEQYKFEISEDLGSGGSVGTISASDKDEGNNAKITYQIRETVDTNSDFKFTIDETSGEIKVAPGSKTLDRNKLAEHILIVEAIDGGTPSLFGRAEVQITLLDVNNYGPVFPSGGYSVSVAADTQIGSEIVTVHARDLDIGANSQTQYSITSNNADVFSIEESTGKIILASKLTAREYNVNVKAQDKGDSSKYDETTVVISLADTEGPLKFLQESPLIGSIKEEEPPGTLITTVTAATSEPVTYIIQKGNDANDLKIDEALGTISSNKKLDYETRRQYVLLVVVYNMKGQQASLDVIIDVKNINDHDPIFIGIDNGNVERTASRNTPIGAEAAKLAAVDSDGDGIVYSINDVKAEQYFSYDNTGSLRVKKSIEDLSFLDPFNVKAKDQGDPPKESEATVTLILLKYPPTQSAIIVKVEESFPINEKVVDLSQLIAYVPDKPEWSIVFPTKNLNFDIEGTTGILKLKNKLDFEKQYVYFLWVRLKDQDSNDFNDYEVEVRVLDENDNAPVFEHSTLSADVSQSAPPGTSVFHLISKDPDVGLASTVAYKVTSTDNVFCINPFSNDVVTSVKSIGNMNTKSVDLKAEDYGIPSLSDTETITVTPVISPPEFMESSKVFEVEEERKPGFLIGSVVAKSNSGLGLTYSIVNGNEHFQVTTTGQLQVNNPLDYEKDFVSKYDFSIKAEEVGTMFPQSVTLPVTVNIININDHQPFFSKFLYEVEVNEGNIGQPVTTVSAKDCDCSASCTCPTGKLQYSMQSTAFSIDPNSGSVVSSIALDYETKTEYEVEVRVHDKGDTPRSAKAYLRIKIKNTNDATPKFPVLSPTFHIAKDAVNNAVIGVLSIENKEKDETIAYSLNPSGPFKLDNEGVLRVDSSNGLSDIQYKRNAIASDGTLSDQISVTIDVDDDNDNAPVFTSSECSGKIYNVLENKPPGTPVATITASDNDRGPNGEIEYYLQVGKDIEDTESFTINSENGKITTLKKLDREQQAEYSALIIAKDGGKDSADGLRRTGFCRILIKVQDVNDNAPEFKQNLNYFGSIMKNSPIGTSVVKVAALDIDIGYNAELLYTIKNHGDNLFSIDRNSGVISTKASLSSVPDDTTYTFQVEVDNPTPPVTSDTSSNYKLTTVEIVVTSKSPPKFKKNVVTVTVEENTKVGSSVVIVSATTNDNADIQYSIIRSRPIPFNIGPTSGDITIQKDLDYETLDNQGYEYTFQVEAKVKNSILRATQDIVVKVSDVNDVAPVFITLPFIAAVLEEAYFVQQVLTVKASDEESNHFVFELPSGIQDNDLFTIVSATDLSVGVIKTKANSPINREEFPTKTIHVVAKDKNDNALKDVVLVTVNIVDINDEIPKFDTNANYNYRVAEDQVVGYSIANLIAYDADIGSHKRVEYFITSGNEDNRFRIITVQKNDLTSEGRLEINAPLDYEQQKTYKLQITASDRKHFAVQEVLITVTDVNDVPPVFNPARPDPVNINENTAPGVSVLTMKATDEDTAYGLIYTLENVAQPYFKIDQSGLIRTNSKPLDREEQDPFYFKIFCSDGKLTGTGYVEIIIGDLNDETPSFPWKPYTGSVLEGLSPGTSVMYVPAVDKDTSQNAKIVYSLSDNANGKFKIVSDSGLVQTNVKLDREVASSHTIKVRAKNDGLPSYSETVATITVEDANDQKPVFDTLTYSAQVPEDALPTTEVIKISATDGDIGTNSDLNYFITEGNAPSAFFVNETGWIVVAGKLDYETKKQYDLKVQVMDKGINPNVAEKEATVTIRVTNANDNAPTIVPSSQTISDVREDTTVGKTIYTFTVSDKDNEGSSETPTYTPYVMDGDPYGQFNFVMDTSEPNKALLKVADPLDYEVLKEYNLVLGVKDEGGLLGKATATVLITDANDNKPEFVPAWYQGSVKEGVSSYQTVVTLSVKDRDTLHKEPFTFAITKGGESLFKLRNEQSTTAEVGGEGVFRRNIEEQYKLTVTASDKPSGKDKTLTSLTSVYVDVIDEINNYEPFDGINEIILNAHNGDFKGGVIGEAYYQDDNHHIDKNKYTLRNDESKGYLTVDSSSGKITAKKDIPLGRYNLVIDVTEDKSRSGLNYPKTVTSSVVVDVRDIPTAAIDNSVGARFLGLNKEGKFVQEYYKTFLSTLGKIFGADVTIFSIVMSPPEFDGVDVRFAVKNGNSYVNMLLVLNILEKQRQKLKELGLTIGALGIDECGKEEMDSGYCRNLFQYSDDYSYASGNYGQYKAVKSILTFVSVKTTVYAKYGRMPIPSERTCADNPCLNGGTCHDTVPSGYVCECPLRFSGPECQSITREFGSGNSYIWLHTLRFYDFSSISLEIATRNANGLILFQGPATKDGNNGIKDFLILMLVDGRARVVISTGGSIFTMTLTQGEKLDNGNWHHIKVSRKNRKVSLMIDYCQTAIISKDKYGRPVEDRTSCEVRGYTRGVFQYVNGLAPLQVGGVEDSAFFKSVNIKYDNYVGCIRLVVDSGYMYDLLNPLKDVNTNLGCVKLMGNCPVCEKGYCEPKYGQDNECVCPLGFKGPRCTDRTPSLYYKPDSFSTYSFKSTSSKTKRHNNLPRKSLNNQVFTRIDMQVRQASDIKNSVLYFLSTADGSEYNLVQVRNGTLEYTFKLGARVSTLSVSGFVFNDNKWHNVYVHRKGSQASVNIDYKGKVEGTTGGEERLMNMESANIFTGGMPNITSFFGSSSSTRIIEQDGIISIGYLQSIDSGYVLTDGGAEIIVNQGGSSSGSGTIPESYYINDGGHGSSVWNYNFNSVVSSFMVGSDTAFVFGGGTSIGSWTGTGATSGGTGTGTGGTGTGGTGTGTGGTDTGSSGDATSTNPNVKGDLQGCTAGNRMNGVSMDDNSNVQVSRQNVVVGCPCLQSGVCSNDGMCMGGMIPYCVCRAGFIGPTCDEVEGGADTAARTSSRWSAWGTGLIFLVLIIAGILMAVALLLGKKREEPLLPVEAGTTHDNVLSYHDIGAGEEDTAAFDISKLIKYSYSNTAYAVDSAPPPLLVEESAVLVGGAAPGGGGGGEVEDMPGSSGEGFVDPFPPGKPLPADLQPKVMAANATFWTWQVDVIHHYRFEGDDGDIDDLSDIEEYPDDDDDQDFNYLYDWGPRFDRLNHIYNQGEHEQPKEELL